ncbi:TIGR03087 family PEP-CTERM/XrtA system glycosyltransferase [Hyphococcus sp. DH-69]|uniref:TIGR03087 family PEP-CTERM/XrtA system glycosyltransferase n=1 Tax=Hyphococcus formosus TaxID=3143534 RepID=UPI00398ABD96
MDEVLLLTHRIPYPPDKGDKIRSWHLLKFLNARFRVHLACFVDDAPDLEYRDFLRSQCASAAFVEIKPFWAKAKSVPALLTSDPQSFFFYRHQKMQNIVANLRSKKLAAEFAFSSTMAPYIERQIGDRKRIVDFCDADSEKWLQYAERARLPLSRLYRREGKTLAAAENKIANWADHSFAVSNDEADIFNNRAAVNRKVDWYTNGVDLEYFDLSKFSADEEKRCEIAFVGAMDYQANIEGILGFVDAVWPKIRAENSGARFNIIGSNPTKVITALNHHDGITVTGRVPDIRPWLASASVMIAPLRVARGIQNKVLEAMAAGKAIVASPEAMTGINANANAAKIAHSPQEMADAINFLLDDDTKKNEMGAAARSFVEAHFSWDSAFNRLENALNELGVYSSSSA